MNCQSKRLDAVVISGQISKEQEARIEDISKPIINENTEIESSTLPPPTFLRRKFVEDPSSAQESTKRVTQSVTTPIEEAGYLGVSTLLLVIASNRPDYLQKSLKYVLEYHPLTSVPILVSQDGDHPRVNEVIDQAKAQFSAKSKLSFEHIHFESHSSYENGYFRLADHFKFALTSVFSGRFGEIRRVIILEEDLQIAPDFFEFFAATAPILDKEKSLLTISAWNDNGFNDQVKDERALYRSDFFPGLGWMMTKSLWEELGPKWPKAYWDDWLREPKQRLGRHILRPEVCRTLHFGVRGVSNAQYSDYLKQIRLNDEFIHFTKMDLSYISEEKWDTFYLEFVRSAPLFTMEEAENKVRHPDFLTDIERQYGIRVRYTSLDANAFQRDSFSALAKWSGAMDNVKAMVPRTAYKGVVSLYKNGVKIHLVPSNF